MSTQESFIINNIKLRVLPTDVTLFEDNAIYATSFVRSKAMFSYRSKYATEKIVLTLPVSISVTELTNDENAIYSREDGLRLLSQLNNYPYCFIQSSRIKSYVAPIGGISSTDFMMFAVEKLVVYQDMGASDLLMIECHLVFSSTSPLMRDFKFKDYSNVAESPVASELFNDAFKELETNNKDVDELIASLSTLLREDEQGGAYLDGSLPYGTTVVLAPLIADEEQNAELEVPIDFTAFQREMKTIEVSAADGTVDFNATYLDKAEQGYVDKSIKKKKLNIAWVAPSDLSFGGVAALQSVKIVRYNNLARQFVSSQKHPVVQYMGRNPARVELNYKINNNSIYEQNISSITAAYTHLVNIVDNNNHQYPEASAYNTLKIRSIAAQALGVKGLVSNQKSISTNASERNVDNLTISFIESDLEDFVKLSKPMLGRGQSSENLSVRYKIIETYLSSLATNSKVVTSDDQFMRSQMDNYKALFKSMRGYYNAVLSEFAGGISGVTAYSGDTVINDFFESERQNWIDLRSNPSAVAPLFSIIIATMKQRNAYANKTKEQLKKIAAKETTTLKIHIFSVGDKTIKPSVNYIQSGIPDIQLGIMYETIQKLANAGDSLAQSALKVNASDVSDTQEANTTVYTGYNFKEFQLSALTAEGGLTDPMYFIQPYEHLTTSGIVEVYNEINKTFNDKVDDVLSNKQTTEIANLAENGNISVPFLNKMEIKEKGYVKESNTQYSIKNSSSVSVSNLENSAGGNYGLSSGGNSAKATVDWNGKTSLNVIQSKAKSSIIATVKNSKLIAEADKKDWTVFLIQLAGRESQLGVGKVSSTGARGLFQIVPSTAKALGYTVDEVMHDFNKATEAAINYLVQIKNTAIKHNYANWIDFYLLYNFGEGGGVSFLDTYSGKKVLSKSVMAQIDAQGAEGINSKSFRNTNDLVRAYHDLVADHFAPMNKYMQSKSKTVVSNTTSSKESNAIKSNSKVSDEELRANYVRVTYYDKKDSNAYGYMFFVTYNNFVYQVALEDIVCPYPALKNCKLNYKPKNNREITYIRKPQPFGQEALSRLISLCQGGIYVRKDSLMSKKLGTTIAYTLQKVDIAQQLMEEGLAFSKPNGRYKNIVSKSNLGVYENPKLPSVRDSEYQTKASKFAVGDKGVSFTDFAMSGYFTDTGEDAVKGISASSTKTTTSSVPSVTTNDYLPFPSGKGTVTSVFGKWRAESQRYHFGTDAVPIGGGSTTICSAANGVVVQAGWGSGGAGNRVRIYHDKIGFSTQYFHLESILVYEGQEVRSGQAIGIMGNTGGSHGAHIHYQVGIGNSAMGNLVNPFKTTKLSEIPPYSGTDPLGMLNHSKKFLNFDYYLSGEGKNLISTGKMFTGDSLGAKAQRQSQGDFSPASLVSDTDTSDLKMKAPTSESKDRNIPNSFSVFNEDEIVNRQLSNMLYPYNQCMNTLFPVVRAYITVGTDTEDTILKNLITLAYYFELDGISDVKVVCNNDDSPVDMLKLRIANPSFTATDNYAVSGKYLTNNLQSILGPNDIEWVADRVKLKAGTKLHVRAGYGNNPNDLTTIFNGVITEVSGEKGVILDVLCEGFGRELLQSRIGADKPFTAGGEFHNSSTPLIFSRSLLQSSINHFGTRSNFTNTVLALLTPFSNIHMDDKADPEAKRLVTKFNLNPFTETSGMGIFFTEGSIKQRMFTNVFAAEIESLQPQFNSRLSTYFSNLTSLTEKSGYFYIFEGQTPWESMKEMEYRCPGTLVKPLMYEDRMTLFFGLKEQMYIAKELDVNFMSAVVADTSKEDLQEESLTTRYLEQRDKRMDLVTRFHIATSSTNILSNGMSINGTFATEVEVMYFEDDDERLEMKHEDGLKSNKMSLDDNLNYWEYRSKVISMPGTHGEYSSFVYGTTALRREAETMYGGKITLIGNPTIKAGDFIYLDDDVKKMSGIIKVRECIHSFGDTGYITEVTPGLYIEASNFYYTSLFLKLGLTAQTAIAFADHSTTLATYSNEDYSTFYEAFSNSTNNSLLTNFTQTSKLALYNTGGMPVITSAFVALTAYNSYSTLGKIGLKSSYVVNGIAKADKILNLVGAKTARAGAVTLKAYEQLKAAKLYQKIKTASNIARATGYLVDGGIASAVGLFSVLSKVRKGTTAILSTMAKNPFTVVVALIGTFVLSYLEAKIQEGILTRQPLMLYPVNYMGRPYVSGISGFSINSWIDSKLQNLSTNGGYISKDVQNMVLLKPADSSGFIKRMLALSYNSKVADTLVTESVDKTFEKK